MEIKIIIKATINSLNRNNKIPNTKREEANKISKRFAKCFNSNLEDLHLNKKGLSANDSSTK